MKPYSEKELSLAKDKALILTKNRLLAKTEDWLSELGQALAPELPALAAAYQLPERRLNQKISRGENHHGFPYRVLDTPIFSQKPDLLLFRLLFLWGEGYQVLFHLEGSLKENFAPGLLQHFLATDWRDSLLLARSEDPWYHFPHSEAYSPLNRLPAETTTEALPYFKLTWPLGFVEGEALETAALSLLKALKANS